MVTCKGKSLWCTTGVQQGEPLSPVLFCAGIAPLIQAVADYFPEVEQLWYLDEGLLYGDAAHVSACLVLIQKRMPLLNMELNLQKCTQTWMQTDLATSSGYLGCSTRPSGRTAGHLRAAGDSRAEHT